MAIGARRSVVVPVSSGWVRALQKDNPSETDPKVIQYGAYSQQLRMRFTGRRRRRRPWADIWSTQTSLMYGNAVHASQQTSRERRTVRRALVQERRAACRADRGYAIAAVQVYSQNFWHWGGPHLQRTALCPRSKTLLRHPFVIWKAEMGQGMGQPLAGDPVGVYSSKDKQDSRCP